MGEFLTHGERLRGLVDRVLEVVPHVMGTLAPHRLPVEGKPHLAIIHRTERDASLKRLRILLKEAEELKKEGG